MTLAEAELVKAKRIANLNSGGTIGNKGGGNTPNWLRKEHQEVHAELMTMIRACITEGTDIPKYLIDALDKTGKYGMGAVADVKLEDSTRIFQAITDVLAEYVDDGQLAIAIGDAIIARLGDV